MARRKRLSDVKRVLLRHLAQAPDYVVVELRDRLWDDLIVRSFMRGSSTDNLAKYQPNRQSTEQIEAAIRRVMRRAK